jgi:hypothetical protein
MTVGVWKACPGFLFARKESSSSDVGSRAMSMMSIFEGFDVALNRIQQS